MRVIQSGFAFALAMTVAAADVRAQQLPEARAVLARYAKEVNAEKLATLPGYRATGTVEYAAMNLRGPLEIYRDGNGRYVQIVTFGAMGQLKEGLDTTFKWSVNASEGPKVTEGQEYIEARERVDPRGPKRDPALVVGAQTLERTVIDSQPCVKVKLTWKSGRTTTDCYSDATGLLVSMESNDTSSMGRLASQTLYSEYKTIEGVKIAMKVVVRSMGVDLVQRLNEVVFEKVDPAKVAPPPEIQALRKK